MRLDSILKYLNIDIDTDLIINNIKTNSKEITKDDLFLAINKGHHYIDEAINNGAIAIITENNKHYDVLTIHVESTKDILKKLALYLRNIYKVPLIGITGSTGKTTTKDLISLILSKKYKVLKSIKNQNNNIGLPLTLLNLNDTYDVVVTEMGMNHPNEISELSKIALPNYGIITNIGSAHIGNLGSRENIFKAKLEILDGMEDGVLILNKKDKYLKKVKYKNKLLIDKKSLKIKKIKYLSDSIEFFIDKVKFKFNTPFKHILPDLFIAIKVGLLFNVDLNLISDAVAEYQFENGRLNVIKNKYTIIDDSYNSSYEAVIGGLNRLKYEKDFKFIILGDILELGTYSKKYHKKINKYLKRVKNKKVLLIGEYTKYIKGIHFNSIEEINTYLSNQSLNNSIIYIKGSRKMNLDKIKIKESL